MPEHDDEDVDACSTRLLTLKNQAPDFFHISRCSAQILHSQMVEGASPLPPSLEAEPPPNSAELIKEVMEEDMEDEEVKEDRCPWLLWLF